MIVRAWEVYMHTFSKVSARLLFGVLAVCVASQSWSVLIVGGSFNGTDVGLEDLYIAETGVLSGQAAEEQWVEDNSPLTDVSLGTKTQNVPWYNTDTANVIAFQLLDGPGYYIVKNAEVTVLLQNLLDINWGVVNLSDVAGDLNLGDDMILSHVSEFAVPEPGTLGLLGVSLLGLGFARRKKAA